MIRENDVREAIAEMQGQKNPNAQTCIKLAAYYTILDHLTGSETAREATFADGLMYSGVDAEKIDYDGDSEFADALRKRTQADVWPVIDELMSTLQVIHPRLYAGVMGKLT